MLYFKPVTETEELKKIYMDKDFSDGAVYCCYRALDGEALIGSALTVIRDGKCFITEISVADGGSLTAEGLIRSALSFGANRGCYMAYCSCFEQSETLLYLGFEKGEDTYFGEIPELLKGACCK